METQKLRVLKRNKLDILGMDDSTLSVEGRMLKEQMLQDLGIFDLEKKLLLDLPVDPEYLENNTNQDNLIDGGYSLFVYDKNIDIDLNPTDNLTDDNGTYVMIYDANEDKNDTEFNKQKLKKKLGPFFDILDSF